MPDATVHVTIDHEALARAVVKLLNRNTRSDTAESGPPSNTCPECGCYGRDGKPPQAHVVGCPALQQRADEATRQGVDSNRLLVLAYAERDKAIQERDEQRSAKERAQGTEESLRRLVMDARGRIEAKVAAMETKLHLDEEDGMDNVRRMERAEATVRRVRKFATQYQHGAFTERGDQTPYWAREILKALDGDQ